MRHEYRLWNFETEAQMLITVPDTSPWIVPHHHPLSRLFGYPGLVDQVRERLSTGDSRRFGLSAAMITPSCEAKRGPQV
jgi:hypothetical protein